VLTEIGLPAEEMHFISNINKSQPKLPEVLKLEEFKTRQFNYISECLREEKAPEGPL